MWDLKVKFSKLEETSEFINKVRNIKKIEYTINPLINEIILKGDNEFNRELVIEALSEIIVNIYKERFFIENIKLSFLPQNCKEMLIKALVLFDIETDIYYVLTMIEKMSSIVISSLYEFRLNGLKNRWHEFSTVTNINSSYLVNEDIYIEFLKFLTLNINPQTKAITLKSDLSKYLIYDVNDRLITASINMGNDMELITKLVLLAPQHINIYCGCDVNKKTFNTLYYLFNNKINLQL